MVVHPSFPKLLSRSVLINMRAASQLSGRGPTDVDVAPVPAC